MENKVTKSKSSIVSLVTVTAILAIIFLFGKIFSMETEQLLGVIIQSVFWLIGILFLLDSQLTKTSWLFCNKEHPFRFQSVFVLCVLIGCLLPFFPEQTWFFVVISICLALLSNVTIGIVSSSFLLVIITQLANCKISTFFLYFLVSIIGIILFSKVEKDMKIGWPIFITVIYQIALQFVVQVFFLKQGIHFDFISMILINAFLTTLLLLILVKSLFFTVMYPFQNRYIIINDQEYVLMKVLKKVDADTYYTSIHCAYLCERIAMKLHLNIELLKGLGYYHQIDKVIGQEELGEDFEEILKNHKFPEELTTSIFHFKQIPDHLSKEESVLICVDSLITAIMYMIHKDKEKKIDYDQLIQMVIEKKFLKGILRDSEMTLKEVFEMEAILMEEKLYYDFLR